MKDIFWLRCNSCKRRGKYYADPSNVIYHKVDGLILNWDLDCKFCNKSLKFENLDKETVKDIYIRVLAANILSEE